MCSKPCQPADSVLYSGRQAWRNISARGVSYSKGDYSSFITRPVSLLFLLVAVFCVVSPYIKPLLQKKKTA
ncbi:MAG: hypothetical protein ACLR0U_12665 [Enterocloster clostridioformis]